MQSIRWKLVLTYLIITALTMGVIGVYITGSMKDYILEQKKINTLAQTNRIAGYISQYQDYSTRAINRLLKEEQIPGEVYDAAKDTFYIFPHVEKNKIQSIEVHNAYGSYTCVKEKDDVFYIKEHMLAPFGNEVM